MASVTRRERHGMDGTPEYEAWGNMKRRCYDQTNRGYPNYGARGIFVEERWRNSFRAFFSDIGPRPSAAHSLERKDNDGPYSKKNCIWDTRESQNNNRRNNVRLTWSGRTQTLAEWCHELGINYKTGHTRLSRGWSTEEILSGIRRELPSS